LAGSVERPTAVALSVLYHFFTFSVSGLDSREPLRQAGGVTENHLYIDCLESCLESLVNLARRPSSAGIFASARVRKHVEPVIPTANTVSGSLAIWPNRLKYRLSAVLCYAAPWRMVPMHRRCSWLSGRTRPCSHRRLEKGRSEE